MLHNVLNHHFQFQNLHWTWKVGAAIKQFPWKHQHEQPNKRTYRCKTTITQNISHLCATVSTNVQSASLCITDNIEQKLPVMQL